MAISRNLWLGLRVAVVALLVTCAGVAGLICVGNRIMTSDRVWVGTKMLGSHLMTYAGEHGGRFPASLDDPDFRRKLDVDDNAYIQNVKPEYTVPATTNVSKLLVGRSKRETVTFYSDGSLTGAKAK